ncbi:MAG: sulfotransferase domain-containing protein [Planctomycetota bacterium]|jgi:hypothetical protein
MTGRQQMIRASHYVTWFLGTRFPNTFPLVFVLAYPKCGTTWVSQLVADYLQLPFPRHSLLPVGFPAVVHGHDRVEKRYRHAVYVLRDGRDALVSYFRALSAKAADGNGRRQTSGERRLIRRFVSKADGSADIAAFVERQLTARKPLAAPCNWADHVRSFLEARNPNVVLLRYEDLLRDGQTALAEMLRELTGEEPDLERVRNAIEKFSFARQAGRPAGEEVRSAWLRKGVSGDWANHFTPEAAEIFDHHCGDTLIEVGYEQDHSWVQSFREGSYKPPSATRPTAAALRSPQ